MLDSDAARNLVDELWNDEITPELTEYIRIPCKSPAFDADWAAHGYMDDAAAQFAAWCTRHALPGMIVETVRLPGRTPVLLCEVPGASDETVLLYGHMDKQPEMTGWRDGFGPWIPVMEDDRLYGRGGADDGYAVYAAITALKVLHDQGVPHARCIVLIEACEESGSFDLPFYIDHLRQRIGEPALVVCLDSGCGDYERLWSTTSLRGLVNGTLTVRNLEEGVHSGNAGGIVPSTFRIARALVGRIEDADTGRILEESLHAQIPSLRRRQAELAAEALGDGVFTEFPWHGAAVPAESDPVELILNRTWRPAMEVTGADGLPAIADAGNVSRPFTSLKVSIRVPPACDAQHAAAAVQRTLEADTPHGAHASFEMEMAGAGWEAPVEATWLGEAMDDASRTYFGPAAARMGEGGTIPFMGMLGEKFPNAQFLVTGVLGPRSNAHGPNEFLHVPTARRVTCCVAEVLARHAAR